MPFIFNRIKPGYCPENDVRLGRNELDGAVCSVQCMHDYDCKGNRLCVSFNLFQISDVCLLVLLQSVFICGSYLKPTKNIK